MSVVSAPLGRMNRQLAGTLTGRVTKWVVLVVWLLIAVGAAMFASKLADVQNNEASSWLPASAESTRAFEKLAPFQDQNAIPTIVVYQREGGLTEADLSAIEDQAVEIAALDGVAQAKPGRPPSVISPATAEQVGFPAVSQDGDVAQTSVTFDLGAEGWNEMPAIADELRDIASLDGAKVYVAGAGGQAADSAEAFGGIDTTLLAGTLSVVIVILLFTYRSPILWVLPIFSAIVALFVSQALIYFLAKYADLTVNGQSYAILTILVIGAGTDYALLLVARYREELRRHEDRHEAMAFALHRAAPALFASAATVALGMLCLLFAEMNSTRGLGPIAAIGIAVTFLVMVTLLPALLVITGRWIFWPRRPGFGSAEPTQTGIWAKVGRWIVPRPRKVWVITSVILAIACLGLLRLDTNGLSTEDSYTQEFQSVTGQKVLVDAGLVDQSNTVMVVGNAGSEDAIAAAMTGLDNVEPPKPPVTSGDVTFVEAAIDSDPSSPVAFATVERVRDAVHAVDGADALVGGNSAFFLDTKEASNRDNLVIIPIILLLVFLILMALLRAVVAPLILIATVVLSFGARARHLGGAVRVRLRLRRVRSRLPVVRLRVPGGVGHRLQHLPDDPGPRGDHALRHPQGRAGGPHLHRRRHHQRRAGAGRDLPGAGDHPGGVPRRARCRRGPRRHPGHDDRPLGARHRDQHGPRRQDLVAQHPRPRGPPPHRRRDRGTHRDRALMRS